MGNVCDSSKNRNTNKPPIENKIDNVVTVKPVILGSENKLNDTMDYSNNQFDKSSKIQQNEMNNNSKANNDINNKKKVIPLMNYKGSTCLDSIISKNNLGESSASSVQKEITPGKNILLDSDYINFTDNKGSLYFNNKNSKNSILTSNYVNLNNANGNNNQTNISNTGKINVSIHTSHNSGIINIPIQDKDQLNFNNNLSDSFLQKLN